MDFKMLEGCFLAADLFGAPPQIFYLDGWTFFFVESAIACIGGTWA